MPALLEKLQILTFCNFILCIVDWKQCPFSVKGSNPILTGLLDLMEQDSIRIYLAISRRSRYIMLYVSFSLRSNTRMNSFHLNLLVIIFI